MITRTLQFGLAAVAITASLNACAQDPVTSSTWQEEFGIANCQLLTTGRNQYFILEPGHQLILKGGDTTLQVTVLNETETVDGVMTRVVEEREWVDGDLYEVSRNYFAICEGSNDVFYFGEAVDYYKNGKVVKHDGAWIAGKDGNRAGMIMPGTPNLSMRFYQEIAPGVAMDRAEIVSLDETCDTPAGTFAKCMKVMESTALNPVEVEYKYHAPGIGLVRDEDLVLTQYGVVSK
jgi:hypothetical protein